MNFFSEINETQILRHVGQPSKALALPPITGAARAAQAAQRAIARAAVREVLG